MPPKAKAKGTKSAKSATKMASKLVEDKTFGLKNKNKSKKVQAYVTQVKKQAADMVRVRTGKEVDAETLRVAKTGEERMSKKKKKAAAEAELAFLVGGAVVSKKVREREEARKAKEEEEKAAAEAAAMALEAEEEGMGDLERRAEAGVSAMTAHEEWVPEPDTIEDELERERDEVLEKLGKAGTDGVKITFKDFMAWKAVRDRKRAKAKEKEEREEAEREGVKRIKRGPTGREVLTGGGSTIDVDGDGAGADEEYAEFMRKRRAGEDDGPAADGDSLAALARAQVEEAKTGGATGAAMGGGARPDAVAALATKVDESLFLGGGDDDDLDDLEDD